MDKIDFLSGFFHTDLSRTEKKKSARKGVQKTVFSDVIDHAAQEQDTGISGVQAPPASHAELERLLDEIHDLGEQLKASPTADRVGKYKSAVKGFLKYVVQNCLKVEEHESRANILNRKRYTLVQVIDQKLERLAAGVLMNQKDQILLLGRVQEIQGLLVDLLH